MRREKLREVVGDNKWRINNILDKKYKPRSPDIIVKEALRQVDNLMEYSVISENCEHFATKLRYGKPVSRQVSESIFLTNNSFFGCGEKQRRVSNIRM